ncbi:GTP-binding protein HflX [Galdieria sulphuraria]|uniref:GTP-binding protein HflX n=1 Tax=Galdieria sulphuraria TaxID=130081 RepID=M2XLT4_GALSU|nr:GTP-binding protein HflX [Galdieria sulphuraria]EME31152.1 GTP-binding protein HflX [Galdieria sulphuraria]|eukprot:XP_005707672.1 GTP-binding protein HflX [Galdieria sulphuraria]
MSELQELCHTAGLEVLATTYQRLETPNPVTFVGSGKVSEIRSLLVCYECNTVVFDCELSPSQQKNLERKLAKDKQVVNVLDRTALILDIFAQHAKTREGKLQVELALNQYRLPRLTRLWTHLERQSGAGGVGLRGPGETQIESDRRLLSSRISQLKGELEDVRSHRARQRKKRRQFEVPVVSLVGYTNAGKSTLLNALTNAGVLVQDSLFATLDPTTRRCRLPGLHVHPDILMTDTVGFIQKLPTTLVAAFRATLEEIAAADILLHVVDISSPSSESQQKAVMEVLREIGAAEKSMITVWNKIDRFQGNTGSIRLKAAQIDKHVAVSAATGEGLQDLVYILGETLSSLLVPIEALIPYNRCDLLPRIHQYSILDVEDYRPDGIYILGRSTDNVALLLAEYRVTEDQESLYFVPVHSNDKNNIDMRQLEDEKEWKRLAKGRHHQGASGNTTYSL